MMRLRVLQPVIFADPAFAVAFQALTAKRPLFKRTPRGLKWERRKCRGVAEAGARRRRLRCQAALPISHLSAALACLHTEQFRRRDCSLCEPTQTARCQRKAIDLQRSTAHKPPKCRESARLWEAVCCMTAQEWR
eukprot:scaffold24_cov245-Pinguiococcus_pyrenoidosus.AAC.7